jgi:branched-chain amino acid transport system substrate-binding protein
MKMNKFAAIVATAMMTASPALAELVIPALSYRTGAYAPSGIPYADGFADYFTMINERDGGIGGEKVRVLECETGYNTQKGVECYEATKGENALVYVPQSTGITYQLIPKAEVDQIPVYSVAYGRTSASNGEVFKWVFNNPGTYWDGASIMIKYVMEQEGGSLQGKKISLVYHNSAYGKEPIRTLEELAKKHGFELTLLPVDHPGQEQKSQWLQIRRDRPDYVFMWGWGVMNSVAIQEATNIRFPMDKFIGIWYSGSEGDVLPAGAGADGYKSITWHAPGYDFPAFDDIKSNVIDKGMGAGDGTRLGEVSYNRGVYTAVVISEAIRTAQKMTGKSVINPSDMRDGFEALGITAERWAELGLPNYAPAFQITCKDHGAPHLGAIQQWDATAKTWSLITDYMEPDHELVQALILEDSLAYAKENNITPRTCE